VVGLEWYPCCRLKQPATRGKNIKLSNVLQLDSHVHNFEKYVYFDYHSYVRSCFTRQTL